MRRHLRQASIVALFTVGATLPTSAEAIIGPSTVALVSGLAALSPLLKDLVDGLLEPDSWPGMLVVQSPTGTCTANAVGPRVVLTAAHCIDENTLTAVIEIGRSEHQTNCEIHPAYPDNNSADYALCLTEKLLPISTFEKVNTNPDLIAVGADIILIGYGCRVKGGIDAIMGLLSGGKATLTRVPDYEAEDLYSISEGAAICFGDAGGGAFVYSGADQNDRILIGIGSRGDIARTSWLATTSTRAFVEWAAKWASTNQVSVCGLSSSGEGCGAAPDTEPDEDREVDAPFVAATTAILAAADTETPTDPSLQPARLIRIAHQAGETVRNAVERACGSQQEDYYQILANYHRRATDQELVADTVLEAEGELDVPDCPRFGGAPRMKSVAVESGDTLWGFYTGVLREASRAGKDAGWKTFGEEDLLGGPGNLRSDVFLEVFRALNPMLDRSRDLPAGTTVWIPVAPAVDQEPIEVSSIPPASTVQPVFSFSEAECELPTDLGRYPFDSAALLDQLATNREIRRGTKPTQVHVLVADTGLYEAGSMAGVFNANILSLPHGAGAWADAPETLRPVVLGISDDNALQASHGTQVASLVLGGPLFARIHAYSDDPRIKLIVERIYSVVTTLEPVEGDKELYRKRVGVGVITNWDDNVFDPATLGSAKIVNLSLKTPDPIPPLKQHLGYSGDILLVVAAGNQDGRLGSLERKTYPAFYGGSGNAGHFNVITVAALQKNAAGGVEIARFSNYGKDWVEIGAYGCSVPVLSFDPGRKTLVTEYLNGTSLAAPLVSFAAALVDSEAGDRRPAWLKRRLLVSADLHADLADGEIEDGRVLNIIKAIALFQDVVELISEGDLLTGRVSFLQNGTERLEESHRIDFGQCAENYLDIPVARVLKLVPNFRRDGEGAVLKIYYEAVGEEDSPGESSLFKEDECPMPTQDQLEILVHDDEADTDQSYSLDQVRDVVMRSR